MTASATFALHLPIRDIPNSNDRVHWSVTARKRAHMRAATAALVAGMHTTVDSPAELTLTFAFPDKRRRDLDNVDCKGLIDGAVTDAHLLPDDDSKHLVAVTRRLDAYKTEAGMCRITAEFVSVGAK